jgi:hypothetical protein
VALGQSERPAKMLIFANNGVTIADYPSMARCEQSRADLQKRADAINAASPAYTPLPSGGAIYTAPVSFRAICFLA